MQKDVIYIDVEDDITAIIGKVKDAKEKIVALVPPKRTGVLQSAVNLRLIERSAQSSGKRLVLITSNQALVALAAAAKIPVAKNLQSKPEIAEIAALEVDDGEDVIDGAQLPVGELARTADVSDTPAIDKAVSAIAGEAAPVGAAAVQAARRPLPKSSVKVPNFDKFRKKLFLIIAGIVLLIGFIIWAIFFAPHATVIITAKTSNLSVDEQVTLDPTAKTSFATNTLHDETQQIKKSQSVDFTATGSKNVGDKATGTVNFSTTSPNSSTLPAGSVLTASNGLKFTLDDAVTVPGASLSFGCGGICPGKASGSVTAAEGGSDYNGASGSVSGAPAGVNASFASPTSGGTDKTVKVVTADDVEKAKQQLKTSDDGSVKNQLKAAFAKDTAVIDQSYNVAHADPVSSPAVGEEADSGNAKLTSETTYSMLGIAKSELDTYLDAALADALKDRTDQRSYDNGVSTVSFTQYDGSTTPPTAKLSATAQIGPKIDDNQVKAEAKGKRYGDVQAQLQAIPGVNNVDIKFSPFWVQTVPKDTNKITVKFTLQHAS